MKLGTAYYPEYNPREKWPEHFAKIRDAGITAFRMGEFAWARIQPEKDRFNWDWFDDSLEMAAKYELEVILGTPTACPPIWLVEAYPEVLPVNREGRRSGFGARQHRCYNSPVYLDHSARVVEALAARYGKHPQVTAWQIDNELGGEQKSCYCDYCRTGFQNFLRDKYGTVEELNRRWMLDFWSQSYQNWTQIPVPMRFASDMDMRHHPSLALEFMRFCSDAIVRFSNLQGAILRRYTNRPITTNTDTFRFGDNVNIYELFRKLDVAGMDIYSENPIEIAFYSDLTRSLKRKPFWMMEYGTGSPKLAEEMDLIRERGAELFCLFTFASFPAGQEQGFNGLLTVTGAPEPSYYTVQKQAAKYTGTTLPVQFPARVGVYYDFDSSWAYSLGAWGNIEEKQVYPNYMLHTVYRSLYETGIPVDFVFDREHISEYETLIMPRQLMYDGELEQTLMSYVEKGGNLIVDTDFFRKNRDNAFLSSVPEIYRQIFSWEEDRFMEPRDGMVLFDGAYGKGRFFMTPKSMSVEEWRKLPEKAQEK